MFHTILSPTDGSTHAEKAVAIAADLAAKYQARLVFLHVLLDEATADEIEHVLDGAESDSKLKRQVQELRSVSAPIPVGAGLASTSVPQALLEDVGWRILDRAKRTAQQAGVAEVGTLLAEGNPAKRILTAAQAENADLIVMGSRGLGALQSVFQGSVSQRIRHVCHCACLTVV